MIIPDPVYLISYDHVLDELDKFIIQNHEDFPAEYASSQLFDAIMRNGDDDMLDNGIAVRWGEIPFRFMPPKRSNPSFCFMVFEYTKENYDEDGEIDDFQLLGYKIIKNDILHEAIMSA